MWNLVLKQNHLRTAGLKEFMSPCTQDLEKLNYRQTAPLTICSCLILSRPLHINVSCLHCVFRCHVRNSVSSISVDSGKGHRCSSRPRRLIRARQLGNRMGGDPETWRFLHGGLLALSRRVVGLWMCIHRSGPSRWWMRETWGLTLGLVCLVVGFSLCRSIMSQPKQLLKAKWAVRLRLCACFLSLNSTLPEHLSSNFSFSFKSQTAFKVNLGFFFISDNSLFKFSKFNVQNDLNYMIYLISELNFIRCNFNINIYTVYLELYIMHYGQFRL